MAQSMRTPSLIWHYAMKWMELKVVIEELFAKGVELKQRHRRQGWFSVFIYQTRGLQGQKRESGPITANRSQLVVWSLFIGQQRYMRKVESNEKDGDWKVWGRSIGLICACISASHTPHRTLKTTTTENGHYLHLWPLKDVQTHRSESHVLYVYAAIVPQYDLNKRNTSPHNLLLIFLHSKLMNVSQIIIRFLKWTPFPYDYTGAAGLNTVKIQYQ